ncbi:MAG: hypothetical protein ACKOW8_11120 [Flavobacteriales bacterium]
MKNKSIMLSATAAIILSLFTSCKKHCHDCHYDGPNGEVELGEKCGDEVEELESKGYTVSDTSYTVHCHEH